MTTSARALDDGTRIDALLERAVAGDEVAFARIVAVHHDAMVRVAFMVTGDLDLADEAAAAGWAIAWRKLSSVRDAGRLRSWLVSVAANEARAIVRMRRRRPVVELDAARETAGAAGFDPATRTADLDLVNALNRLSVDDRLLISLRYVAGLDSFEIAAETGRSASGTRARLARVLDHLRRELSE